MGRETLRSPHFILATDSLLRNGSSLDEDQKDDSCGIVVLLAWNIQYTLAESARANKLDVYEYLKYLLTEMPNNAHLEHPEVIDQYLPWSKELPDECRLEHKHKKCFKNDVISVTDFLPGCTTSCFEALTQKSPEKWAF